MSQLTSVSALSHAVAVSPKAPNLLTTPSPLSILSLHLCASNPGLEGRRMRCPAPSLPRRRNPGTLSKAKQGGRPQSGPHAGTMGKRHRAAPFPHLICSPPASVPPEYLVLAACLSLHHCRAPFRWLWCGLIAVRLKGLEDAPRRDGTRSQSHFARCWLSRFRSAGPAGKVKSCSCDLHLTSSDRRLTAGRPWMRLFSQPFVSASPLHRQ